MCGNTNEGRIYTEEEVMRISEGMCNAGAYSVLIGRPLTEGGEFMFAAGFVPASIKVNLDSEETL